MLLRLPEVISSPAPAIMRLDGLLLIHLPERGVANIILGCLLHEPPEGADVTR